MKSIHEDLLMCAYPILGIESLISFDLDLIWLWRASKSSLVMSWTTLLRFDLGPTMRNPRHVAKLMVNCTVYLMMKNNITVRMTMRLSKHPMSFTGLIRIQKSEMSISRMIAQESCASFLILFLSFLDSKQHWLVGIHDNGEGCTKVGENGKIVEIAHSLNLGVLQLT